MITVTERWVREALGLEGGSASLRYPAIGTDTRTLAPGALFVALAGERFDGHDFLDAAARAGARAAVVRQGTPEHPELVLHRVPDTLRAYGLLARHRRRQVVGPVVAITGTNGKTSTKELMAAALRTRFRTYATRQNLNNLVGVPQTILEAPPDTEALVVEAGANLPGEIASYRAIIEPSLAMVTNVGAGHLEGFGSLDGVMQEKLELVRGVPVAVVGTSPARLPEEARRRGPGRVITAGLAGADVVPDRVELTPRGHPRIVVGGHLVRLGLLGRHQAANAMLVWAAAAELGLDASLVAAALETVTVPGGRGELTQAGQLTILNDCYNANPQSFASAIETAVSLRAGRRLVFVAGTMRELGEDSARLHGEVAAALVALEPELLAATGDFVEALGPWAGTLGDRLVRAPDAEALAPLLAERLRGDELVVLKASRGVALERILPAITRRAAPAPTAEA